MSKKISIIIVTYNSSRHIFDCLESLFKHNNIGDDLEVIVVDNNSEEQKSMFSKVCNLYGNRVKLKGSGKNGGYGFGNNIGIRMATSDVVIVMDPDVRFVEPILNEISLLFDNNKALRLAGVSFVDGSAPFYYKPECENLWQSLFMHQIHRLAKYSPQKMYMSGSFLAFNKNAFEKAGKFDEAIFMYYEEADITNRILSTGYQVEWHPEIKVHHIAHGRSFNEKLENIRLDSFEYYCHKYNVSAKKVYEGSAKLLGIKILVSWLVRDNLRYYNFKQTRNLIKQRLTYLK